MSCNEEMFLYMMVDRDAVLKKYSIHQYSSYMFKFYDVRSDLSMIGNKISSLFPYLLKFYEFLQNFGIKEETKEGITIKKYEFNRAVEMELELKYNVD